MRKNLRNVISQKATKFQKDTEERIKQRKNEKEKIKEPIPEQEPNIVEKDVSEREKDTTSEEES